MVARTSGQDLKCTFRRMVLYRLRVRFYLQIFPKRYETVKRCLFNNPRSCSR